MPDFLRQLGAGISKCGLADARVLLAVSGGPDSVAMLRGMHSLADDYRLELVAAHLNHQLRGEQSDADAVWLKSLCESLDVPLVVESRDVAASARERGLGIEETARAVRYDFLKAAAVEHGCTHVAVAHTADDQAETILHHIVRGTGLDGLRGMRFCRELDMKSGSSPLLLVRPLLEISRVEIEQYLLEIGQEARCDASNLDVRFTRNRLRQSLLPLLERDFNPHVREALQRLGRQSADLQDFVQSIARDLLQRAVLDKNVSSVRLDCEQLSSVSRHVVRESVSQLWKECGWPRQKMGFDEWDKLAGLILTEGKATFPGNIEAVRRGKLLVLRKLS